MPERSDRDWLNDILDEIALARQLTQSMDYDKFGADPFERLQASSPETLAAVPDVPWPDIRLADRDRRPSRAGSGNPQ